MLPVFEAEVPIALDVDLALGAGRLAGRIDGLIRSNGPWRIEEYKATRDPQAALNLSIGDNVFYAACRQYGLEELLVAVVYVHPESLREQFFEQRIAADYAIQYWHWRCFVLMCASIVIICVVCSETSGCSVVSFRTHYRKVKKQLRARSIARFVMANTYCLRPPPAQVRALPPCIQR